MATIGALMPRSPSWCSGHAAAVVDALALVDRGALPNFASSADATRAARCYDEDTLHWLAALAQWYDPAGSSG